ncbi:lipocalin-like domain-containing protein [Puniceibacterium sediminis]|uniref:Predicted secreted hydrolase n=1 Tax=Puniceibacterium sediminis TaxID=1608407 RepID=A0A238WYK1_9RHOB|nr:lipocalin-like domain-containing protein [Puniceibacterium sediminis]SNR51498.1 Predicted secreted hydrolase [Puniceibacterium sediminis]
MIARALTFLWICLSSAVSAQGFAGLGTDADGYALPSAQTALTFPTDHLSHPDFRIEWWYLTANLQGADGREYGVQWTLFRSALAPETGSGWQTPQIWMGHAALTSARTHRFAQKLARGGIGQAGVTAAPFDAFIDDWQMQSQATTGDPLDALILRARGDDFAYDLNMRAQGDLVLQGDQGFSLKSPTGEASYYYSQPFYQVSGTLTLPDGDIAVTGQAWLDHEWSSQPLNEDQDGWDWLSLHFEDGSKMMGFGLRSGSGAHFTSATWVTPVGETTAYGDGALALEPLETARVAGRDLPVRWRVTLPARGIDIVTEPLNPQSWMGTGFPYWEGPIRFSGTHSGSGYLEMTGYD